MVMQYTALLMNDHAFNPLYVMPASCAVCNSSSNVLNLLRANDFQSSSLQAKKKWYKLQQDERFNARSK